MLTYPLPSTLVSPLPKSVKILGPQQLELFVKLVPSLKSLIQMILNALGPLFGGFVLWNFKSWRTPFPPPIMSPLGLCTGSSFFVRKDQPICECWGIGSFMSPPVLSAVRTTSANLDYSFIISSHFPVCYTYTMKSEKTPCKSVG